MEQDSQSSPLVFRSHTALLLSTALPFLQPSCRHPVELVLKFLEFSETLNLYREARLAGQNPLVTPSREPGLFGMINTFVLDLEGLLNGLGKVCTGSEKELIQMFLGLIRAKNFYETYGDLMKSMMPSEGDSPFPFSFPFGPASTDSAAAPTHPQADSPFPSDLSSMLNKEQQETLDLLKSLFSDD